jgi:hypothetical protein
MIFSIVSKRRKPSGAISKQTISFFLLRDGLGKTSLMRKMGQDSDTHGYTAVYVDVSDCTDELHFVQRL